MSLNMTYIIYKYSLYSKDWPLDVCNNYGLFISSSDTGKHGKFLDETRPLSDYALHGISGLEVRHY